MTDRMGLCRVAAALGFLLAILPAAVLAGEASPERRGSVVGWKELRFVAHKTGISATIDLRLDRESDGLTDGILLESTTHLPGRTFVAHERVDAVTARARQIVDTETGVKHHRKTYTLGLRGFRLEFLEPASLSEMMQPPERWTKRTDSVSLFPQALPPGSTVTGPAGLLYAISAANLAAPGDSMTIHVLVQTHVERVTVRVEGTEPADVTFEQSQGGEARPVREQVTALRLVARSQPVESDTASAFRIFGLEGDVEILWDPAQRLPLEISGHVKVIGQVTVRLASVTLP
ncbi:MAG: hypothetical protein ABR961_08735 [Thermoanaerobaculaceae bacterium]